VAVGSKSTFRFRTFRKNSCPTSRKKGSGDSGSSSEPKYPPIANHPLRSRHSATCPFLAQRTGLLQPVEYRCFLLTNGNRQRNWGIEYPPCDRGNASNSPQYSTPCSFAHSGMKHPLTEQSGLRFFRHPLHPGREHSCSLSSKLLTSSALDFRFSGRCSARNL
jgi:hypothetical protein